MDEIASLAPLYSQATYDRLEGWNSLCWGSHDGSDTPLLYVDGFNFPDKLARLSLDEWIPPVVAPDEYDLLLNNGRMLEHFHEGNMTNKSAGILSKVSEVFVEISPELAIERNVKDGGLVELASPFGKIKVQALITDRVTGKELYLPMHATINEEAINILTGTATDLYTCTPAYKQTMVKMRVLREKGNRPLPPSNPRDKNRNPQNGVEIEQKWQRKQYVSLVDQGAEIVAKEITLIKKKVVTEEEQKQQVADALLNELSNNREAVEETMQLLAQLQKAGILDAAISLLAAKEDVSKIAVEQLNREPVKNALNNMMGAGEALSSVDPEVTKQITSSLVTGLQFATDELNSGKKTKVMDFFKVLKDPDINRAITFGFSFLKAFGQGLEKKQSR